MQAYRDNERIAVDNTEFAAQLWEATGLQQIFNESIQGGHKALGLNPNLRLYR